MSVLEPVGVAVVATVAVATVTAGTATVVAGAVCAAWMAAGSMVTTLGSAICTAGVSSFGCAALAVCCSCSMMEVETDLKRLSL